MALIGAEATLLNRASSWGLIRVFVPVLCFQVSVMGTMAQPFLPQTAVPFGQQSEFVWRFCRSALTFNVRNLDWLFVSLQIRRSSLRRTIWVRWT